MLSLKLQDDHHHQPWDYHKSRRELSFLLRAKIPISIFNLPFLSHFSATTSHPSDLALSLSTNFSSGPSLKISYATTAASSSASANPPFAITLKSGTGLFGSPNNSPLVISAHFSYNPSNPNNPNPTFSLFLKPRLGSFSLRKSTFSHPKGYISREPINGDAGLESNSVGFVPLEGPAVVKDLPVVRKEDKVSIFKGIQLMANTQMPVGKKVALNCRWGLSFPENLGVLALRINKIGIQRVDEVVKEDNERSKKHEMNNSGELEMLKGMCFWMKREMDVLTRINSEIKSELAEMKAGHMERDIGSGRKKGLPSVGSPSGGFEQWRSKKNEENGQMNGKKEEKKNGSLAIDVENELQRAIKAAASAP